MIHIDPLSSDEMKETVKQLNLLLARFLPEWVTPEEAKKLLGIKSKTKLQQLRDSGEIVFSIYKRTIMYSRSSINDFLERHAVRF